MVREPLLVDSQTLDRAVSALLIEAGFRGRFTLHQVQGGSNNRVYRVEGSGFRVLLKSYFQHADDPRDRLGTEFSFSRFVWENGLRCLPRPLACDPENRLGLYEFVEGRSLLPHELTEDAIRQALHFYQELNRHREHPDAKGLPRASESCYTLAEHLHCVETRLQNLKQMRTTTGVHRDAAKFVRTELSVWWSKVAEYVCKHAQEIGGGLESEIAWQDKRLSPSDFGFHNVMVTSGGRLCFIDFEYAGWDDPVKMICDFFGQQAMLVPMVYHDLFVTTVTADLSEPERHHRRIALLLPVHWIKWCCILLNDFLPVGDERRGFARHPLDQETYHVAQLEKARRALHAMTQRFHHSMAHLVDGPQPLPGGDR